MVGQTKVPLQRIDNKVVVLLPPGKVKPIFMFELHIDIRVSDTLYSHHHPNWIARSKIADNEGEESNTQQDDHQANSAREQKTIHAGTS